MNREEAYEIMSKPVDGEFTETIMPCDPSRLKFDDFVEWVMRTSIKSGQMERRKGNRLRRKMKNEAYNNQMDQKAMTVRP